MNGYAASDQTAKMDPTLVYTVLGYTSTVKGTGSLTIRDVVVDVNAANGALVAAVSVVPGAASNVNVYGFGATLSSAVKSVGQTPYLNGVGGLYQWLNPTTLAYVKGQYLNGNGINGMTTANGAKVGLISGVLNFTLAAPSSLSCPLYTPQAQEPFGVVNVTVTPQSSNSSYLQLTGNFRAGDFQNWNFTTSAQTGYSLYVLDVDGTQWLNTTVTRTPATAANGTFNNTKWTKLGAVQTPVGGTYTPLR